eukprot:NODE_909_length_3117_cov_0.336978.p1 type:complete len:272 gc:universal NODE_909_length_3117_cov_0.336978:907-1722(+)
MNVPLVLDPSLKQSILSLNNNGMFIRIENESFYKVKDLESTKLDLNQNGFICFHSNSLFIYNYVPDNTPVKDKLLYANGEMVLLNQLNTHVQFINKLSDATFKMEEKSKVLTHDELHQMHVRKEELLMDLSKVKLIGGNVEANIANSLKSKLNETGLIMTIKEEVIELVQVCGGFNELIDGLKSSKMPVYGFWRPTNLFVSYCPQEATIKDRMIFTTFKNHVQSLFSGELQKIEASDPSELPNVEKEEEMEPVKNNAPRKKIAAPGKRTLI